MYNRNTALQIDAYIQIETPIDLTIEKLLRITFNDTANMLLEKYKGERRE